MKEAHVHPDTTVTIHDVPIPQITHPSQILVKVVVSGTNPKDWKMPASMLKTISHCPNSGDDVAGFVHAIGTNVTDFHIGDRVAALHELGTPGGSYAEYSLVWDWTTFQLGNHVSFEEAATVPMAALMASIGIFGMLELAAGPWAPVPTDSEKPLVIYGAASAVGAYAVKLAKLINVHPLICVAGKGIPFVKTLLGEGDTIIDYREGNESVVEEMRKALKGNHLKYAFDATSEHGSYNNLSQVLADKGKLTLVLPFPEILKDIPPHIEQSTTMAGSLWKELSKDQSRDNKALGKLGVVNGGKEFGLMFTKLIARWLNEGKLQPHPYEVVEGGLHGIETALKASRGGKVSAIKYVIRIADTPDLSVA
ncbi:MAG: hypothetical protein ALECFALPRED_008442 [Alectoria fallacina]|uniref:Enoyl reductase (ER) domain-containing protein n=1 Tax=Alectoria fallacina TaxID=1903189 RepID=A0A8H3IEH2_9LECA|nr:MAG: hypothetical protein ALECFALPRED_008442 [Alectoria fallacina]